MRKTLHGPLAGTLFLAFLLTPAAGGEDAGATQDDTQKHVLRYTFQPGETVRWKVVHRNTVHTTVAGTTQTAETISSSVKVWRIKDAAPDGTVTFEQSVEDVDMRQQLTGRDEVRYNSRTDEKAPVGFEHLAESVGVTLAVVTMDARGKILKRRRSKVKAAAGGEGPITIPLPHEPVGVGQNWSRPHDLDLPLPGGGVKKIKTVQQFTLLSVKTGVATIRVDTQILTPVDDPAIEAQLIQHQSSGTVRFDADAGRIIAQQMDLDKKVIGFRGGASRLHYLTRFTEELLPSRAKTARGKEKAEGGRRKG